MTVTRITHNDAQTDLRAKRSPTLENGQRWWRTLYVLARLSHRWPLQWRGHSLHWKKLPTAAAHLRGLAFLLGLLIGTAASADEARVILLSWDGVRHDYLDRAEFPALARVQRQGARAERLIPVFPSSTFPNHVSLATGTWPDRHGIVDNVFRDHERGIFDYSNNANWITAEPLWVAAERQAVRSALYFWVGSESDWNGTGTHFRVRPFDAGVSENKKVEQIIVWLDLPAAERPRLIMSWWHGADKAGHRFGPDSPRIVRAIQEQDRELARLLAALDARRAWSDTTLLIVSDHGMTHATHILNLKDSLHEQELRADVLQSAGSAHIFLKDPVDAKRAVVFLNSLDGVRAYPRDAIPEHLRVHHPSRTGDIVALATPPLRFGSLRSPKMLISRAAMAIGSPQGAHGYDPRHPDMAGILLAIGRGVAPGTRLPAAHVIDVAPTAARLLGIEPPHDAEGEALAGIGAPQEKSH